MAVQLTTAKLKSEHQALKKDIVVGIDASRNRSGGARSHLLGILAGFSLDLGIQRIHLWAYRSLLDSIPDRPWLVKHHHPYLERSLAHQLFWQAFHLKRSVYRACCDILFATDASTVCTYSPLVVLSQDLLSYEPGVMETYPWGKDRLRLEVIKIVQNKAFKRSKGVLFLTKYASELVQDSCGILKRTALAPHGIDDEFRDAGSFRLRKSHVDATSVIRCIYISNTDMYKHQWHVVEAIRHLRNNGFAVELKLIGGQGSGLAQEKLLKAITQYDPKHQYVTLLNFVDHSDLPRHLSQADIFIFASSCENLPVTLLEGMASGLPIACSNRGPMPEVLKDAGIYFDPEDSNSIAAAVQFLIQSQDIGIQLASKAQDLASAYSWERCAQKTFGFIRDTYLNEVKEI